MSIDSNAWYILESVASNSTRSLQWCTLQIVCNSDSNLRGIDATWQFVPLTTQSPTGMSQALTLRNRGNGTNWAVGVSAGTNETQPGLFPLDTADPAQLWDITSIGEGIDGEKLWFIRNVANGTNFNLAEHGEGTGMAYTGVSSRLSTSTQTWLITKVGEINDPAWSPSPSSSTFQSPTSTSTVDSNNNMSKSSGGHSLSKGAIAGVVIGVVLGVILLFSVIFAVFRRRQHSYVKDDTDRSSSSECPVNNIPVDYYYQEKDGTPPLLTELPITRTDTGVDRYELPVNIRGGHHT